MRRADPTETHARTLAIAAGIDPDSRVARPGETPALDQGGRGMPAWCAFRDQARREHILQQIASPGAAPVAFTPQPERYRNAPLVVHGTHEETTIAQMRACMGVGHAVAGVLCADGHLGYAQPVGGVIGYEGQISVSGVGFDIACGNMAVRLDTPYDAIAADAPRILQDVTTAISFGVGRRNAERAEHALFDDADAWRAGRVEDLRGKAQAQLGTVGSGNHYVDLMRDEAGLVWIGVHFGSRGLGHTTATRYLGWAGGKDGMHVPPTVLPEDSELGQGYLAAMELSGRYAYAGREWVVERVRRIIGGAVTATVHNHHNFAWRETHGGRDLWVVRKGATPAWPGQRGFVGGSMGDDAVIIEGVESPLSAASLYSTVHGAGRTSSRKHALRTFTRGQMAEWLRDRQVLLSGGGLDESPMAYRRLPEVLANHADTIRVLHRLRPFAVAMAGPEEFDPFKD